LKVDLDQGVKVRSFGSVAEGWERKELQSKRGVEAVVTVVPAASSGAEIGGSRSMPMRWQGQRDESRSGREIARS